MNFKPEISNPPNEFFSYPRTLHKAAMPYNRIVLLIAFLLGSFYVSAQDTTLVFEKLGKDEFIQFKPLKDQRVYAAGRIMEDQRDIPRVIHVITKEQISLEGYSTLVDVLKDIPGFRVSQPGSALLGETFLNRGMIGNIYAKILINGLPVNPSGAPGMPIGSQLPIRQAERVEIIVDPSSTLYGSDAMAGVINIVLPEINRPVQVTSDVRLGGNELTEISTSIGGKIGKDKNVFSYSLYGTTKYVGHYQMEGLQLIRRRKTHRFLLQILTRAIFLKSVISRTKVV